MALSPTLCDREQAKFKEDADGETAVNVCNTPTNPINVTGAFTVAAPGPIKVSGTTVTATSATFPATNQADRAALSIRNIDPLKSIFIVNSVSITKAAAGLDFWEVGPNESLNTDLDDTSGIILVADAGETVSIQIMEIKGP